MYWLVEKQKIKKRNLEVENRETEDKEKKDGKQSWSWTKYKLLVAVKSTKYITRNNLINIIEGKRVEGTIFSFED